MARAPSARLRAVSDAAPLELRAERDEAMEHIRQETPEQEPLGIVISRGSRAEEPPRFSAYVWSDAPELPSEPAARAA